MNRFLHFFGTECGELRAAGANPSFTMSEKSEQRAICSSVSGKSMVKRMYLKSERVKEKKS